MKALKIILALLFGGFASVFLYLDLACIFFTSPPGWFVGLTLIGGWAAISYWVQRDTTMISEVLGRSFLVTAILSFGLTPAVLILSAKAAATVGSAGDGAAALGGLIGGGLVSSVGIGISLFFTVLSLIAYALVKLYVKEGSNKTARLVPCAMCSEPIQKTAKKCRFCGEMV